MCSGKRLCIFTSSVSHGITHILPLICTISANLTRVAKFYTQNFSISVLVTLILHFYPLSYEVRSACELLYHISICVEVSSYPWKNVISSAPKLISVHRFQRNIHLRNIIKFWNYMKACTTTLYASISASWEIYRSVAVHS